MYPQIGGVGVHVTSNEKKPWVCCITVHVLNFFHLKYLYNYYQDNIVIIALFPALLTHLFYTIFTRKKATIFTRKKATTKTINRQAYFLYWLYNNYSVTLHNER
jgi:hypothetical protein